MRLTTEQADRLAQERPPYPSPSDDPAEFCPGTTGPRDRATPAPARR